MKLAPEQLSVAMQCPEWLSIKSDTNEKWSKPGHWTFQIFENLKRVGFITQTTDYTDSLLQSVGFDSPAMARSELFEKHSRGEDNKMFMENIRKVCRISWLSECFLET